MKKVMILAFAAGSFMISCKDSNSDQSITQAEQEVAAETGVTYTLDQENSSLKWKAYHKGGLDPRFGTVKSTGTISAENGTVTGGSFVIDINSLTTDPAAVDAAKSGGKTSADLDAHLKNADFFEVDKYPTAKFEITKVAAFDTSKDKSNIADANFMVSGNLTLKDKTVNVTFPAKITVSEMEVVLSSNFTINRQDWGLTYGAEGDVKDWGISQEVDIELNVKAKK
ncbi:YceI family protein [Moheibacter sediminis]|nr:YceI family protein [Moheibacter sediminis]